MALRYSGDNFSSDLATWQQSGTANNDQTIDLSSLTGLEDTVEFRIVVTSDVRASGEGTITSAGTFRVANNGPDVRFNGNVFQLPPSENASELNVSTLFGKRAVLDWENGTGDNRIVVMREGGPIDATPSDAVTYNDNRNAGFSTFGLGDEIGTGNFVVYNGDGSSVEIQGLSPDTEYYFTVFEYNGSDGTEGYLTTGNPEENFTTFSFVSVNNGFESQSFGDWYVNSVASDLTW